MYNFAAMEDIAIMKQMHKHEAQVQSLREIFHEIDNQKSSVAAWTEYEKTFEQSAVNGTFFNENNNVRFFVILSWLNSWSICCVLVLC